MLKVEGLTTRYGSITGLRDASIVVQAGEIVGVIGPNGAGKTTLLKLLAGELALDAGNVTLGHHVKVGYFAQHHADTLHPDSTPFQEVAAMDPEASVTRVRTVLGAFLFRGDDVEKKIRVLSGGERARVALARLLINPGNFLMMDEPTNHLDLGSSESLAESLASYDGTVMFVSHNRSFVNKLATQIWNLENGKVEVYPGTLDEFMYALRTRQELAERTQSAASAVTGVQHNAQPQTSERQNRADERERKRKEAELRQRKSKLLKPLKERVSALEAQIEALENEQKAVTEELSDPSVYADAARRDRLLAQFEERRATLAKLTEEWEQKTLELEELESSLEANAP